MSVREAPTLRQFVPRSLSISPGIQKAGFYQPKLSGALIFASFTIANVIARGGHPAATFLIKRKWPKIDRGGPRPPQSRKEAEGGSGLARHWFHGRFQASALPLVKLWAVLRSDSHPAGGVGPACRSIRGRIRASTCPRVGLALPEALHS